MSRSRAKLERLERALPPAQPSDPTLADELDTDPHLRYAFAAIGMPLEILRAVDQVERDPRRAAIVARAESADPLLAEYMRATREAVDSGGDDLALPTNARAFDRARWRLYHNPENIVPCAHGRTNRYTLPLEYDMSTVEGAAEAVLDHWAHATATLHKRGCEVESQHQRVTTALAWLDQRDPPA